MIPGFFLVACSAILTACGSDYEHKTVQLAAGASYRGRTLKNVHLDTISVSRPIDGNTYTSYFKRKNPDRGDGSCSLGNPQHLWIHALAPEI